MARMSDTADNARALESIAWGRRSEDCRDRKGACLLEINEIDSWNTGTDAFDGEVGSAHSATGRLEAVDLKARKFRIRDDVGNGIDLDEVADVEAVAPLVGLRTRATGSGVLSARGQLESLVSAVVEPDHLPATWVPGQSLDLADVFTVPGPNPDGVQGLTSRDVEELLAGLHGC